MPLCCHDEDRPTVTQKNRQAQLFTGPVRFTGAVEMTGPVTIHAIKGTTSQIISLPQGLVVAMEPGAGPVVADSSNLDHADRILGISLGSGNMATSGELGALSGITPGDILYLNGTGTLATTPPSSGFQQKIAVAISPTSAILTPGLAIIL